MSGRARHGSDSSTRQRHPCAGHGATVERQQRKLVSTAAEDDGPLGKDRRSEHRRRATAGPRDGSEGGWRAGRDDAVITRTESKGHRAVECQRAYATALHAGAGASEKRDAGDRNFLCVLRGCCREHHCREAEML